MYIERIEKFDQKGPRLKSVISINPKALEVADKLDRRFEKSGLVGPLHGIPVLLKDNINTKDIPTTAGSISLEGLIPEDDAFITKKLKEAGAIILAKMNLHEFAIWGETISSILGQTLNPYDLKRTAGGSSGGTGAGIAMNFGVIGIGTDTVNSIRSPTSACNLVGLRPTVGLVSREGNIPCSLNQDTSGPIMRTVEDTARVLDVIAKYDKNDPATAWSVNRIPKTYKSYLNKRGLERKRIGILRSFFGDEKIHQEVNEIIDNSIEGMKDLGVRFIDIKENIDSDGLTRDISLHLHDLDRDLSGYLERLKSDSKVNSLKDLIESGKYHEGIEENIRFAIAIDQKDPRYNERLIQRKKLRNLIMEIMAKDKLDAILYPHQKQPVVKIGDTQVERNGALSAITGFPAITVPAGFTKPTDTAPIGIPVGIEFLGREWDESTLLEISYGFEFNMNRRKKPVLQKELNVE